jgi:hypothetical protein
MRGESIFQAKITDALQSFSDLFKRSPRNVLSSTAGMSASSSAAVLGLVALEGVEQ